MSGVTLNTMNLAASANRVAQSLGTSALQTQPTGIANRQTNAVASPTPTTGTTITSNDFLKLLVTEMKNQDPTQPTDPNAYIQQLVGVNSLQQLIAINKELQPPPSTGKAVSTNPIQA